MVKRRKTRAATATNIRMFWLRPFIIFYIVLTIFLFLILDKSISFWVSVKVGLGVIMNPDLDNIPGGAEGLLGKPNSSEFEDDITGLIGLDSVEIDRLLLCVEHPGRI